MSERLLESRQGRVAATAEPHPPAPAPGELARISLDGLERETSAIERAVVEARAAYASNQPEHWTAARARLERAIATAARALDRVRERTAGIPELTASASAAARGSRMPRLPPAPRPSRRRGSPGSETRP